MLECGFEGYCISVVWNENALKLSDRQTVIDHFVPHDCIWKIQFSKIPVGCNCNKFTISELQRLKKPSRRPDLHVPPCSPQGLDSLAGKLVDMKYQRRNLVHQELLYLWLCHHLLNDLVQWFKVNHRQLIKCTGEINVKFYVYSPKVLGFWFSLLLSLFERNVVFTEASEFCKNDRVSREPDGEIWSALKGFVVSIILICGESSSHNFRPLGREE